MKTHLSPARQHGIALVITLIMLSVTLIMAVAFLAISNRERGSVTTTTDAAHARQAADSALAYAEAQIISSMQAAPNSVANFGPFVSTNYINPAGFLVNPKFVYTSPTNVNYLYPNGAPLTPNDLQQNIANLFYLPRAPVFIPNNNGTYDFRYYLDLNRNGQFDDSGNVPNTSYIGGVWATNGTIPEIGDPQWIGVLEHPDRPHGPDNRFVARFAVLAIPVGNSLDINAIYNDADQPLLSPGAPGLNMLPGNDSYLRNEGVGSWELNLPAFLTDLNTNEWDNDISGNGYHYNTPNTPSGRLNVGAPFEDSLELLRYRYNYALVLSNQASAELLYGYPPNSLSYLQNGVDNYSVGPLMVSPTLPTPYDFLGANDTYVLPWSGADNTNHFFTPSDFFNKSKTQSGIPFNIPPIWGFTDRLLDAGTNTMGNPNLTQVPTYNRYTFYNLLSQLGTDTTPDYGKMNLNYRNITNGVVIPGMETNFYPWSALDFFTNAANRLLGLYTTNWYNSNYGYFTNAFGNYVAAGGNLTNIGPFGVTSIPVLINGQFVYSPAIHRLLQLAANMYDATTNSPLPPLPNVLTNSPGWVNGYYPSVFKPLFYRDPVTGNVFINGYQYVPFVSGVGDPLLSGPVDALALAYQNLSGTINSNIYGVPWIIGAKKGFPSFNELYDLNSAQVTRLLQVNRYTTNSTDSANYFTNEMFVVAITNTVGMSFWNSYYNTYTGSANITVFMQDNMSLVLTNAANPAPANPYIYSFGYTNILASWPGSFWNFNSTPPLVGYVNPNSFMAATWNLPFLYPSVYWSQTGQFIPLTTWPPPASYWETNVTSNYPFPQFGLMSTNWVQAYVLDGPVSGNMHVIDYVHFSGPNSTRNLSAELADPNYVGPPQFRYNWSTNVPGYGTASTATAPTYGEVNQLGISRGLAGYAPPPGGTWVGGSDPANVTKQQTFFNGFYLPAWQYNGKTYVNTEYSVQAPYTPTRTMYDYTLWQANDPLVHYLASDLNYVDPSTTGLQTSDLIPPVFNVYGLNLNQVGFRYQPWGQMGQLSKLNNIGVDTNAFNLAFKDPLVWGSDFWNFPTNKFPTVGWLGAVHRGTPWQTVFLKSTNLLSLTNFPEGNPVNGLPTWEVWTGVSVATNSTGFNANNTSPTTDRLLFDLFTTGPNENATRGKLSVNQTHLAAWSAALSGLVVYTNANTNVVDATLITPAGPNGFNYIPGNSDTYLAGLYGSIQQTRGQFPGQAFQHLGDVLATPALSDGSPFLPGNNLAQSRYGISDAMYEWIPRQTLSLLTLGTPRYVIYCYGQALKPAPNSIITSGPYALMCTNYQVVAESAQRAVLQVQLSNNIPTQVILKNLNPLPPDQ